MKIFSQPTQNSNLSLALGYFDGVHKGHQSVIKRAVEFAKKNNTKSAVITFKDHPCCFFWGVCPKYILTREERRSQIEKLGVDYLYELDFEKISTLSAEEYLENILVKYFSPIAISTGFNHYFGANKSGDTKFLQRMTSKYNYEYFMLEAQQNKNEIISSTAIRNLLSSGEISEANNMLGYKFPISGLVTKGQQLGRKLGFRTANIVYPSELITLPFGVYSSNVFVNNQIYKGVTNFGIRPTVSNGKTCSVETHILDFDEDIYGKEIRIEFINMIRAENKFDSVDKLKSQIQKDIELVKQIKE